MIHIGEPLFWLLALCLSIPWGIVTWLGFDVARLKRKRRFWKDRYNNMVHQLERERLLFDPPQPLVEDRTNVIPMGGKHQRPRVVDVPFKGPIS